MSHTCHALGCSVEIPPKLFMHKAHWIMIPVDLQRKLLAAYRPGQEIDKKPSKAYLCLAGQCIVAVAQAEDREVPPFYRMLAAGWVADVVQAAPLLLNDMP